MSIINIFVIWVAIGFCLGWHNHGSPIENYIQPGQMSEEKIEKENNHRKHCGYIPGDKRYGYDYAVLIFPSYLTGCLFGYFLDEKIF